MGTRHVAAGLTSLTGELLACKDDVLLDALVAFRSFLLPVLVGIFASIMMFGGSVFGAMENDEEVGIIMSGVFGLLSFLYARFMNKRKRLKKGKLVDLADRLQQILERRQKVSASATETISIPEDEYDCMDEIEIKNTKKVSE